MWEKVRQNSDAVVGFIMLLLSVFVVMLIMQIKSEESRIMPLFAVALIAGSALILVFRTLVLRKSPNAALMHKKREIIVWAMYVVFFILIHVIGFFTSSFLFTCVCFLYLRGGFTREGFDKKKLLVTLVFALLFVIATYLCFIAGFKVSLPRGILI